MNYTPKIISTCVQGRPSTKQLVGYIELYSAYRLVVCLSDNYSGPEFSNTYSIDPTTGMQLDVKVDITLTNEDLEASYRYEKIPPGAQENAMTTVLEISIRSSRTKELQRQMTAAMRYACQKMNIAEEDEDMPNPDQYNLFIGYMLERLTPYLIHHLAKKSNPDEITEFDRTTV